MITLLKKYIREQIGEKSFVFHSGAIIGCPKRIEFISKGTMPMLSEKSKFINKLALKKAITDISIEDDKSMGIFRSLETYGSNYFVEEHGNIAMKTIMVLNDINELSEKALIINNLTMFMNKTIDTWIIDIHSYYSQEKKTVLANRLGPSIRLSRQGLKAITELNVDELIDLARTNVLNERIVSDDISEREFGLLSLNTLEKNCKKCLYFRNCTLSTKEVE